LDWTRQRKSTLIPREWCECLSSMSQVRVWLAWSHGGGIAGTCGWPVFQRIGESGLIQVWRPSRMPSLSLQLHCSCRLRVGHCELRRCITFGNYHVKPQSCKARLWLVIYRFLCLVLLSAFPSNVLGEFYNFKIRVFHSS